MIKIQVSGKITCKDTFYIEFISLFYGTKMAETWHKNAYALIMKIC